MIPGQAVRTDGGFTTRLVDVAALGTLCALHPGSIYVGVIPAYLLKGFCRRVSPSRLGHRRGT